MKSILFTILTLCGSIYLANNPPKEVIKLIDLAGQLKSKLATNYWADLGESEMPLLLVNNEKEFVFNTSVNDPSFNQNSNNYPSRPASFNKQFLATFPLLNNKPTIVVGTPENTGKTPEAWTATIMHEHFHQLQMNHPKYYVAQKALKLDKGDQTGMWMLNHPFPYEDEQVNQQIKNIAFNLLSTDSMDVQFVLKKHQKEKAKLHQIIGDEHYKYLNLQLWQEGFARFVEMELTNEWIDHFDEIEQDQFSKVDIQELSKDQNQQVIIHLTESSLKDLKRVYFYSLGAAEAKLITKTNPKWKEQYFDSLFTTDHLIKLQD